MKKFSGKYHKYENMKIKERKKDEKIDPLLQYFALRSNLTNGCTMQIACALISKADFHQPRTVYRLVLP